MTRRERAIAILLLLLIGAPVGAQTPQGAPPTPPPPAAPIPRPTLAAIDAMLAGARAKAGDLRISLSCAIVDITGNLVAAIRMDNAAPLTMLAAQGKARTSAMMGMPSGSYGERGPQIQAIGEMMGQNLLTVQGGVPIMQGGMRVGGIGCSGAPPQQDEEAAIAGTAAAAR